MTIDEITNCRLVNQQICRQKFIKPGEVISWLGAVQAQDFLGAKWSVGLRLPNSTDQLIEQALADKDIIRTWPMRGTLHFVAPEDVRWMLKLLTPRIVAGSVARLKKLDLDEKVFSKSKELFIDALQGGKQLERNDMYKVLEEGKVAASGQRGLHILWRLAQDGLICFGGRDGKQQTFVLLDEWVPEAQTLQRGEALEKLIIKYFSSHGPATIQDFIWWTGLTATQVKSAMDMLKSNLNRVEVDGQVYWTVEDIPFISKKKPSVFLLPGFDEYLLGYKDRSAALDTKNIKMVLPSNNGLFNPTIVINGRVAGTWRRTIKKEKVFIETKPFTIFSKEEKQQLDLVIEKYGKFLMLIPEFSEKGKGF